MQRERTARAAAEGGLGKITVGELIRKISDELAEEPPDVTERP